MEVLGIVVEPSLLRRWARWLAPERQPFFLTTREAAEFGLAPEPRCEVSPELRDTYELWNVPGDLAVVRLDEQAFHGLPRPVRAELVRAQLRHGRGAVAAVDDWADVLDARGLREQADGQHFVWWPGMVEPRREAVLRRVVTDGHLPCRRTSVPADVWRAAASVLPRARELSGTFADGSGANCFGTVMAAAGVPHATERWIQLDAFEGWLATACADGGRDDRPGTVLVWRGTDLSSRHAAVALGGGWALHKASQSWASPRQVLAIDDLVRTAPDGVTLHRYSLGRPDRAT